MPHRIHRTRMRLPPIRLQVLRMPAKVSPPLLPRLLILLKSPPAKSLHPVSAPPPLSSRAASKKRRVKKELATGSRFKEPATRSLWQASFVRANTANCWPSSVRHPPTFASWTTSSTTTRPKIPPTLPTRAIIPCPRLAVAPSTSSPTCSARLRRSAHRAGRLAAVRHSVQHQRPPSRSLQLGGPQRRLSAR